jgi:diketogulonate reductase-like aldo/keto reductase
MPDTLKTIPLPSGEKVPTLGQGTWEMGDSPKTRTTEIEALQTGLQQGLTLLDTAEMYGDGDSEKLIAEMMRTSQASRETLFLVSKVYPHNGSEAGVKAACDRSLKRLNTDYIDMYLLHWRGGEDLEQVIHGFEQLKSQGKIRHWGVSNFDTADMVELFALPNGNHCATNQILYNVARRGPEYELLPWMRERKMPAMAYSPVDHARLPKRSVLNDIAEKRQASVTQIALAWVLAQPDVIAIPKASTKAHVLENAAARAIQLTDEERALIDSRFPAPTSKRPLEIL